MLVELTKMVEEEEELAPVFVTTALMFPKMFGKTRNKTITMITKAAPKAATATDELPPCFAFNPELDFSSMRSLLCR